jgi:hypothetical protein
MYGAKFGLNELIVLTVALIVVALVIFAWSRVFAKAGYSPILCLLMLIPVVNLLTFLWFAFSRWPIQKQASFPPNPTEH